MKKLFRFAGKNLEIALVSSLFHQGMWWIFVLYALNIISVVVWAGQKILGINDALTNVIVISLSMISTTVLIWGYFFKNPKK